MIARSNSLILPRSAKQGTEVGYKIECKTESKRGVQKSTVPSPERATSRKKKAISRRNEIKLAARRVRAVCECVKE